MAEKNENCSGPDNGLDKPNAPNTDRPGASKGSFNRKEKLLEFTGQLSSLGALQQAILRNLQKEIEKV
ncbi:MAG: hypothetical protein PHP01_05000 [Phycisphaerae bacterium]|nr:hypothetical protein [Phycisphaerae bacterium]